MHWKTAFQHLIPNMLQSSLHHKLCPRPLDGGQEEDNHALEELLGFPLLKDGTRLGWLMNLNSVSLPDLSQEMLLGILFGALHGAYGWYHHAAASRGCRP